MAFQSFLSNRASVRSTEGGTSLSGTAGDFQRLFDENAKTETVNDAESRLDAPQVDVIEENGRVAKIVITCRCCERIELVCRY